MFSTAAQSITKKAPQQAARIQRSITSDAFAFYPVRKTRYDQAITTAMAPQQQQQQVARINTTAAVQAENHSFGFYPVQRNRVRTVTPKANRDCYGYYPANNVVVETTPKISSSSASATIQDVKAIRAALIKQQIQQALDNATMKQVLDSARVLKKTATVLP